MNVHIYWIFTIYGGFMANQKQLNLESIGFRTYHDTQYGHINDIFFNVCANSSSAVVRVFIDRESAINLNEINLFLEDNKKMYRTKPAKLEQHFITVILRGSWTGLRQKTLIQFVQDFSAHLKMLDYHSVCADCGKRDNLGLTVKADIIYELCSSCHEKRVYDASKRKQERENNGSYMIGSVGAMLGGLVSIGLIAVLYVLMLNFEWIGESLDEGILLIAALPLFFCYFGYRLFNGKMDKGMSAVLTAVLTVTMYFAVIIFYGIWIFNHHPELFDVKQLLIAPFLPDVYNTRALWIALGILCSIALVAGTILFRMMVKAMERRESVKSLDGAFTKCCNKRLT